MPTCNHKTPKDHIAGKKYIEGKLKTIWICSNCKSESAWTEKHSNYGKLECYKCEISTLDWVACSDECANKLKTLT